MASCLPEFVTGRRAATAKITRHPHPCGTAARRPRPRRRWTSRRSARHRGRDRRRDGCPLCPVRLHVRAGYAEALSRDPLGLAGIEEEPVAAHDTSHDTPTSWAASKVGHVTSPAGRCPDRWISRSWRPDRDPAARAATRAGDVGAAPLGVRDPLLGGRRAPPPGRERCVVPPTPARELQEGVLGGRQLPPPVPGRRVAARCCTRRPVRGALLHRALPHYSPW